jgi:hypothetical protein
MWTPGRGAAAFATANGDPNKIQIKKYKSGYTFEREIITQD